MPRIRHSGLFKRCGHASRAWPTCSDPWWLRFHHGGFEYRFSINKEERKPSGYVMDKDEARKLQNKYKLQIQEGSFRQTTPKASDVNLTVGDVMKLYVTNHVSAPERKKAGQVVMKAYISRLGTMRVPAANGATIALEAKPLDAVTAADLDVLRRDWTLSKTAAQGGRTGPQRALKRLRHFFNWAIKKGYADRSPFKRGHVNTQDFFKEEGRTRRLEGDEERRLLASATTPLMRVLIPAGLETGCRIGELLQITWADVKWDQGALLLPGHITKTGNPRGIPLTQRLLSLLQMLRHAPDGTEHGLNAFVFGDEFGDQVKYWRVNEAWKDTCAAANISGLHLHDLRREMASRLCESGAPIHDVREVLGHADLSTTSRYLKTNVTGLKKSMQRMEQHGQELAEQKAESEKRQLEKHDEIRTPFAQQPVDGASDAVSETPAKWLN